MADPTDPKLANPKNDPKNDPKLVNRPVKPDPAVPERNPHHEPRGVNHPEREADPKQDPELNPLKKDSVRR